MTTHTALSIAEQTRMHHALSDPARLHLLALCDGSRTCQELEDALVMRYKRLSQGTVAYHLRILYAVFIAGDKAFKTSPIAYQVIREAKRHKKHVHIARRNSLRAVQEAYDMGADTVDGTYLKYGPDINWHKMQNWFR